MPNQQLVDYIKAQLAAGAIKPDIRKAVATAGWPLADIERAFMAAERPAPKAPAPAPVAARPLVQPQAQPQPVQPLVQVQPQTKPLPVIHMHPQDGLLRSGWFWSFIVLLLLVGAGAATYFLTPVGSMIKTYFSPPPPAPVVEAPRVYTDSSGSYSFEYPEGRAPVPRSILEEQIMDGEIATSTLPEGTVEVPGIMLVSKVSTTSLSKESAIYDYDSGFTGTRYWFDAASSTWKAESIYQAPGAGSAYKPLLLATTTPTGTTCTLARQVAPYTLYYIESGDEGVPTHYNYFLHTDQGYALRFLTPIDLAATTTDPAIVQSFMSVVSSVKLIDSAPVVGHCS